MFKRLVLLTIIVAVLTAVPASALDFQQKQWYGQGIVALPMGDFGDFANLGLGLGAGLTVPHNAEWAFRGEISYTWFSTEDIPGYDTSASLVPVTVLAQYNLEASKFYFLGGLGLVFANASVDYNIGGITGSESDTSTEFGLTLGSGYVVSPKVDLGARFNFISDANTFSMHVVYKF